MTSVQFNSVLQGLVTGISKPCPPGATPTLSVVAGSGPSLPASGPSFTELVLLLWILLEGCVLFFQILCQWCLLCTCRLRIPSCHLPLLESLIKGKKECSKSRQVPIGGPWSEAMPGREGLVRGLGAVDPDRKPAPVWRMVTEGSMFMSNFSLSSTKLS